MGDTIPYRVEYSKTRTAGCKGSAVCKREKVKIAKSELRFGTWVVTEKIQGWQWRHWGCVTSRVLKNVHDKTEGDYELLDGLDELFEDDQEKVRRALSNGEIDKADISEQALEDMKGKEAKEKEKGAEKEAKKLQKEKAKEDKKAENEKQKEEKKVQKEEETKAKNAEKLAAKASKAKKRKRDTPDSDTDEEEEEDAAPKRKRNVKQEDDDDVPQPKPEAKKGAVAARSNKTAVKKENKDGKAGKKVKEEDNGDPVPKSVRKFKTAKSSDMDGVTDKKPLKGRDKTKASRVTPAEPTRRSTRKKR